MNQVLMLAPWLSAALLIVLSLTLPNRARPSPEAALRQTQIAAAFADVPLFINGTWVGRDEQVAPEAQRLLRPNAMLSRRYEKLGARGASAQVLVVHCGDARDMIGHYPPVCYPSAGFLEHEMLADRDLHLSVGGLELPVRQYRFHRARDRGSEEQLRIFNAFILPDGTITRDIDDINRQSERLAVTVQGVAQLQVVTPAAMPLTQSIEVANELLGGMPRLFDALNVGQGASS